MFRKSFHIPEATLGRPRLRWEKVEERSRPRLVLEIPVVLRGVDLSVADDVAYYAINAMPVEVDIKSLQGELRSFGGPLPEPIMDQPLVLNLATVANGGEQNQLSLEGALEP